MAVSTKDGVTTLTPTAWKWFLGAAAFFIIMPGFGWIGSIVFVLIGAGVLQRMTLTPEGVTVRNWGTTKSYAWAEIDDFRVYRVRSGLIKAADMVSFTHISKDGSVMGTVSKFLVGGTHSVPAIGMPAKKLVQVMEAYKRGFIPKDSEVAKPKLPPALPAFANPSAPKQKPVQRAKPRPRAVPATPRAQQKQASKQPNLGGTHKARSPLVQEGGGLFGRRRSDSPFRS